MPEFIRMEPDENRIKDVGIIENCVHALVTVRQRKSRTMMYHIIYSLITAVIGYISIDGLRLGLGSIASLVCLFAYPALYVYTLMYSPAILKAAGALLPLCAYSVRYALLPVTGEGFLSFATGTIGFLMCLSIASMMGRTVVNKCTKLWCFTAVTCCIAIGFAAMGVVYSMYMYGSVDGATLTAMLNDTISSFSAEFGTAIGAELENPIVFAEFSAVIPDISDMSAQQAGSYFGETMRVVLNEFKTRIPGIFVFVCMMYSFVFTGIFSVAAKIQKIPLFVCIMDNSWCYRIPSICITFFDIVLFLIIIASIFGLPVTIGMTVENLLIILLPLVTISTFKAIHFFLYGKFRSKAKAYVLCVVIGFAAFMFMGMWGYLLICSLGVSLVSQRYRIECAAAKEKIKLDTRAMLVLCGCKEPSELKKEFGIDGENTVVTDNTNDTDNTDSSQKEPSDEETETDGDEPDKDGQDAE